MSQKYNLAMMSLLITFMVSSVAIPVRAKKIEAIQLAGALQDPLSASPGQLVTREQLLKDFPTLAQVKTQWEGGPVKTYSGVWLKDFIQKYGAQNVRAIKVTAIDDYSQELTAKDWNDWGALLALMENGVLTTGRQKGPFRIIYDYNRFAKDTQVTTIVRNNSVWLITRIEFLK